MSANTLSPDQPAGTVLTKASSSEQPFRFLDLPTELRFMIYEKLKDNEKNSLRFRPPIGFNVESVYLDNKFYPNFLLVNKQISTEYSTLTLRDTCLWITYNVDYNAVYHMDDYPEFAPLSNWVEIPKKILAQITDVIFKFEIDIEFPHFDPFLGIPSCVEELSGLMFFSLWVEFSMELAEPDDDDDLDRGPELFEALVENMQDVEFLLLDIQEEKDQKFFANVKCRVYCPLYELRYPATATLRQGVPPAPGLPKWGHAIFDVVLPYLCPDEDVFDYQGQQIKFNRVEYGLPVPPRDDSSDSFEYGDTEAWYRNSAGMPWAEESPPWN